MAHGSDQMVNILLAADRLPAPIQHRLVDTALAGRNDKVLVSLAKRDDVDAAVDAKLRASGRARVLAAWALSPRRTPAEVTALLDENRSVVIAEAVATVEGLEPETYLRLAQLDRPSVAAALLVNTSLPPAAIRPALRTWCPSVGADPGPKTYKLAEQLIVEYIGHADVICDRLPWLRGLSKVVSFPLDASAQAALVTHASRSLEQPYRSAMFGWAQVFQAVSDNASLSAETRAALRELIAVLRVKLNRLLAQDPRATGARDTVDRLTKVAAKLDGPRPGDDATSAADLQPLVDQLDRRFAAGFDFRLIAQAVFHHPLATDEQRMAVIRHLTPEERTVAVKSALAAGDIDFAAGAIAHDGTPPVINLLRYADDPAAVLTKVLSYDRIDRHRALHLAMLECFGPEHASLLPVEILGSGYGIPPAKVCGLLAEAIASSGTADDDEAWETFMTLRESTASRLGDLLAVSSVFADS